MENENATRYFSMLKGVKQSETLLQKQLCLWMRSQYPHLIFIGGMQGFHLSATDAAYAAIINQPSQGLPDLLIVQPVGPYVGMAMELKKDGAPLYKKDNTLRTSEHLKRQADVLESFRQMGWYATFGQGFVECQRKVSQYLSLNHE